MNFDWLFQILTDHLGEILLGLEFFVLSKSKNKNKDKKELDPAKVEKIKAKKLKKAQALIDEVEEMKKEEN